MRFSPSIVIALVTLNSVSAFSPNGMRIAPALVSTPTRSDRSHAVSRVEKPYGISTISSFSSSSSSSLNSVFTREDDAETPELDGGETPTEDEIRRIKSIRDNEFVPEEEGLMTKAFSRMKLFSQKRREEDETNDELFGVLKSLIIGGSYKFNSVDLEDEITFTSSTREILWGFEIKKNIKNRLQIAVAYPVLKNAPALKTDIDTELMTQKDYDDLSEGFVDPHEAQMKVENPEQCFLKNAPAFCKPQDDGTSVCNLNYLATYQVRKGTVRRYGGLAVVKDGKIIEVSGVKESDGEAFELEKAVFFNSFAVHVVLVRHAVMGHLALYQKNLMKVTANRSDGYEELWKKHLGPELLMKALTPSATNDVNTNIQLLIGPGNSLVGRATSFTNDSLTLLNTNVYDKYASMTAEEVIADVGGDGSEGWNSACHTAWKAAHATVYAICKELREDEQEMEENVDEYLDSLALLLWTGTFYHGFIGDFQLDNVVKGNLPFLITGKPHVQTKAYGTLSATIGISTMTRTMNMATLGTYFPEDYQREAWETYMKTLQECRKETGVEGFDIETAVYNAIDF